MGYWKSFAVVGSITLAALGLFFVLYLLLNAHPITTGITIGVVLFVFFVAVMAEVAR